MRLRSFADTDLVVSEVGFGVWTLATDWWGEVTDKAGLVHAALDGGITFFDTAPVYGDDGLGETILADLLGKKIKELVITTKCGYDIRAPRIKGQGERPHDWNPESVRRQLEDSLKRLGREHIDLYQLHNPRIDAIESDELWDTLVAFVREGKVRQLGVALGPAIGWVSEGNLAINERPIASLQTVFNILEQEPGLTFMQQPGVVDGRVSCIARVPHASDVLNGRMTRERVLAKAIEPGDHRSHRNWDNLLDMIEKLEAIDALWHPDTGRTVGQAAVAGILAHEKMTCVLPTATSIDEVREYAAASDLPLSTDEAALLAAAFNANFHHEDRYVMPLKTSVGG